MTRYTLWVHIEDDTGSDVGEPEPVCFVDTLEEAEAMRVELEIAADERRDAALAELEEEASQ